MEAGLATMTEQSVDGHSIMLSIEERLKDLTKGLKPTTPTDGYVDSRTAIVQARQRPRATESSTKVTDTHSARVARLPRMHQASPASCLELSSSFQPWSYTTDDGIPKLFSYYQRESKPQHGCGPKLVLCSIGKALSIGFGSRFLLRQH